MVGLAMQAQTRTIGVQVSEYGRIFQHCHLATIKAKHFYKELQTCWRRAGFMYSTGAITMTAQHAESTMPDTATLPSRTDAEREFTTRIVAAYIRGNNLPMDALPGLISSVFQTLNSLGQTTSDVPDLVPAVPVKKSVFPDYIICLEDGKKLKMLKRHLQSAYGMSPQQYREKWGLPANYPMVAPSYSIQRSALAHGIGLGRAVKTDPSSTELSQHPTPITQIPEKKRGRRSKLA